MVTLNHGNTSLRLLDAADKGIRTFSGIRRDATAQAVQALLQGVSDVSGRHATNAVITRRAELVDGR